MIHGCRKAHKVGDYIFQARVIGKTEQPGAKGRKTGPQDHGDIDRASIRDYFFLKTTACFIDHGIKQPFQDIFIRNDLCDARQI